MRIAYVEDNATNLALVERVARMNNHVIVPYSEGEIAVVELKRQTFDLILMDIELAGEMSGLQVVKQLRQEGLETPIIAVTAYAMMGDRERFLEAGCNDYLPKPLPISELLMLLAKYDLQAVKAAQAVPVAAAQATLAQAPAAPAMPIPTPHASAVPVAPSAPVSTPAPGTAAP